MIKLKQAVTYISNSGPNQGETLEQYRKRRPRIYNLMLILLCILLFGSNVVQSIFFKRMADDIPTAPYFLLLFCSMMFIVVFGAAMVARWLIDKIKLRKTNPNLNIQDLTSASTNRTRTSHGWLAAIGFLDSINGLILLFAASRTAPMLHPILVQAVVLITFIASYLLRTRKLNLRTFSLDFSATFITMLGVIISLIPVFIAIHDDPGSVTTSTIWPIVFLMGVIPGAIMNVVQEKATGEIKNSPNFDYLHLLTWVSIYQVLTDLCLFWTNYVNPGVSIHNLGDLGNAFDKGFACLGGSPILVNGTVVGNCAHAAFDTGIFISGYVGTYIFSSLTINLSSSLLTAVANAIVTPAVAVIYHLAGMDTFTWYVGMAIFIMLLGAVIQVISDHSRDTKIAEVGEDDGERGQLLEH